MYPGYPNQNPYQQPYGTNIQPAGYVVPPVVNMTPVGVPAGTYSI